LTANVSAGRNTSTHAAVRAERGVCLQ
jgi:hypothetical protein